MRLNVAAPSFPDLPRLSPLGRRPQARWIRPAVYALLAVILLWLLSWSRAQSRRIVDDAARDAAAADDAYQADFTAALSASSLPAPDLTVAGLARAAANPRLASALLTAAAHRDPQYRDAALGAGFAELAVAGPLGAVDPAAARRHAETARTFLEAARAIDPIHARTYELLAAAYGTLGEPTLAADAAAKAQAFALRS